MTGWTGTLYLIDRQGRDHAAQVLLPGPLSLSRDLIAGLDLPEGFALRGLGALTPVDGPVPGQAVLADIRPHAGRARQTALAVEDIAFESPPVMAEDLPCPARLAQALVPGGKDSRLYLLFDAARLAPLLRVFEPSDLALDRQAAALFLSEGMARQSPWLVDVTPDEAGATPRLMRQFLRSAWNQRAGIFLRSRAPFDEMFRFLRGFTRVHDGTDDEKTILLRFWDSVVARHWFAAQARTRRGSRACSGPRPACHWRSSAKPVPRASSGFRPLR